MRAAAQQQQQRQCRRDVTHGSDAFNCSALALSID